MRLSVQEYLDNNKAHLEYINTPSKPRFAPSYVISGTRADEFVEKYNKQSASLMKNSCIMTVSGLVIGWGMALSKGAKALNVFLKSCLGALIGLGTGIAISKHEKNKLMNEYHVEEV